MSTAYVVLCEVTKGVRYLSLGDTPQNAMSAYRRAELRLKIHGPIKMFKVPTNVICDIMGEKILIINDMRKWILSWNGFTYFVPIFGTVNKFSPHNTPYKPSEFDIKNITFTDTEAIHSDVFLESDKYGGTDMPEEVHRSLMRDLLDLAL